MVIDSNYAILPGSILSYRGYNDHAAISYKTNNHCTVSTLNGNVDRALKGYDEFQGYKGGTYKFSEKTPVWISNYGECTDIMLVGVQDMGSYVLLEGQVDDE